MKINAGCGKRYLPGYTNIDVQHVPKNPKPDIIADLRSVPLEDSCADEILAIHVFEHFYRWEVPVLLAEWKRLLKPGGLLVLELPDLIKCCRNIIALEEGREIMMAGKDKDQTGMWGLYGDPRYQDPYMCHRWGWSANTLTKVLKDNGFGASQVLETVWHPVGRRWRDMRIEAKKPE